MASSDNIFIDQPGWYFRLEQPITFTNLFTKIRTDYRSKGIMCPVLLSLKNQTWLTGELKNDAAAYDDMWGIGEFRIFNMNPDPVYTDFPACIVDWHIFKDKWAGKTVRTLATYTDSKGTCKIKWYGV